MKLEDIYESFFDTYRNVGHMISELSRQTMKTAKVEAERRAKESEEVAEMRPDGDKGDRQAQDLARRNAEVKRRQAEKFGRKLYVQSGGTARADAVPDYKSGEQKKKMDAAAIKRHPNRDSEGKVTGIRAYGSKMDKWGRKNRSAYEGERISDTASKEFARQKKRYGR